MDRGAEGRVLNEAAPLRALALTVYLKRQGVSRQEYARWQQALREDSPAEADAKASATLLERAGVSPVKDFAFATAAEHRWIQCSWIDCACP